MSSFSWNSKKKRPTSRWKWLCNISILCVVVTCVAYLYFLVLNNESKQTNNSIVSSSSSSIEQFNAEKVSHSANLVTTIIPGTTYQPQGNSIIKVFSNTESEDEETIERQNVQKSSSTNAEQLSVFDKVRQTLSQHSLHQLTPIQTSNFSFEDYFTFVKNDPKCSSSPLFVSMANVFSDLYWQMIENFIYTMVKFDLSACAIMVCVSDSRCMERCRDSLFPCINFRYSDYHPEKSELPHTMEQIAELKLFHIPKALDKGVDVVMLDLDVGFLSDPRRLLEGTRPKFDVYVQKDIAYVMNRTEAGWRTWYTVPLPNIGIMYVRANKKSVKMFQDAWNEYKSIDKPIKHNPGKDQNKVAGAMQRGWSYGFRWAFFPAGSAVLLDMMYKFNDPRYELGGQAAFDLFTGTDSTAKDRQQRLTGRRSKRHEMSHRTQDVGLSNGDVYAVHTTCYEQSSKIHGLKAANAYWNPFYYTANRRTLTKPLVYITKEQLRHEVRTLLYLAHATNRSLIIPNILGNGNQMIELDTYRDQTLWPGFRVLYEKSKSDANNKNLVGKHNVKILEPAYYWRVQRDYFLGEAVKLVPEPVVVPLFRYDPSFLLKHHLIPKYDKGRGKSNVKPERNDLSLADIESILQSPEYADQPRLVLNVYDKRRLPTDRKEREMHLHKMLRHVRHWAKDSVGDYNSYDDELFTYGELPRLTDRKAAEGISDSTTARWIIDNTRLCKGMFEFDRGNRSCFDKCK